MFRRWTCSRAAEPRCTTRSVGSSPTSAPNWRRCRTHERPSHVTVVVLTDGHENSSREWTHEAVSAAIGRQERDYSWEFVFLGANMDAVAVGAAARLRSRTGP